MESSGVVSRMVRSRRAWASLILLVIGLLPMTALAQDGPTVESLAASIDYVWVMVAAILVFLMQAGFALLEAGSVQTKAVGSVFMKNLMDFMMCGLAFWAFGFAIMFGEGNAIFGSSGFFLAGSDTDTALLWFFQMVFAATAATIVGGAVAGRTRLDAYMAYSFLISAIVYPVYGHWVWGGGWLAELRAVDFAGSGVVHAVGGVAAFVGARMVGPRRDKFTEDGEPRSLPGHNMGFVALGTLVLFFGWFGFNPGSTFSGQDPYIPVIAVNTFLAGIAGGLVAYYMRLAKTGKADLAATAGGIIGGLVGVTGPAPYVDYWAALVIGAISGAIVLWAAGFLERRLRIDDPVWAIACHGVCGLWGLLAIAIFANGQYGDVTGLITGDGSLIVPQLVSIFALVVWVGGASWAVFAFIERTIGLRVSPDDEEAGVDHTEYAQPGYVT